jgi:hypothetical protein
MKEKDAVETIQQVLQERFPELRQTPLKILFTKKADYYMAISWRIFRYHLYIDQEILLGSRSAFTGCLAHELAHIVLSKQKGFFWKLASVFLIGENAAEERAADHLAIVRGLGEDLLQFHREHNRKYKSYRSDEGLTKHEIKKLLGIKRRHR